MTNGGDILANELITSLLVGEDITIPSVDLTGSEFIIPYNSSDELYNHVTKLTNNDLTTRTVNGSGTFDSIMAGLAAHLKGEFDNNRISGAEYTKAFIALAQIAMNSAVQYLLGKDTSYWQAVQAQAVAITAKIQLASAKVQNAAIQLEAKTARANFALTKLKLSGEDIQYAAVKYNLDNMLPAQKELVDEQIEGQRSQSLDTRRDNTPVAGLTGKQKDLYSQQITSYQRDSELKASKVFTDGWITYKTLDESAPIPVAFDKPSVDAILAVIKTNNGL